MLNLIYQNAVKDLAESPFKVVDIFRNLLQEYTPTVINILVGLLFLFIGWLIAKFIYRIIHRVLKSLKLDKLDDQLREVEMFQSMNLNIPKVVAKLIYYMLMMVILIVSVDLMGIKSLSAGIQQIMGYVPKLLSAAVIFIIGVFIANIIRKFIRTATESLNIGTGKFIADAIFYFLVIIISLTALNQAGIDTSLLTNHITMIIGAILVAFVIGFGFASRDLMASLLGSFYAKDKISVGQTVKIGDIQGIVTEMDTTSLTLQTGDNTVTNIPLHKLSSEIIEITS